MHGRQRDAWLCLAISQHVPHMSSTRDRQLWPTMRTSYVAPSCATNHSHYHIRLARSNIPQTPWKIERKKKFNAHTHIDDEIKREFWSHSSKTVMPKIRYKRIAVFWCLSNCCCRMPRALLSDRQFFSVSTKDAKRTNERTNSSNNNVGDNENEKKAQT